MPCLESECQLGPVEGPMQDLQQVDILWSTGECSSAVEQQWILCGALVSAVQLWRSSGAVGGIGILVSI